MIAQALESIIASLKGSSKAAHIVAVIFVIPLEIAVITIKFE